MLEGIFEVTGISFNDRVGDEHAEARDDACMHAESLRDLSAPSAMRSRDQQRQLPRGRISLASCLLGRSATVNAPCIDART